MKTEQILINEAHISILNDVAYIYKNGEKRLVKRFKFEYYYIGDDTSSLLFYLGKQKYIYIGTNIYQFKMTDVFIRFYSPVWYTGDPAPFIVGSENVYMLEDMGYVKREHFGDIDFDNHPHLYMLFNGYEGDQGDLGSYIEDMKGLKKIEL